MRVRLALWGGARRYVTCRWAECAARRLSVMKLWMTMRWRKLNCRQGLLRWSLSNETIEYIEWNGCNLIGLIDRTNGCLWLWILISSNQDRKQKAFEGFDSLEFWVSRDLIALVFINWGQVSSKIDMTSRLRQESGWWRWEGR